MHFSRHQVFRYAIIANPKTTHHFPNQRVSIWFSGVFFAWFMKWNSFYLLKTLLHFIHYTHLNLITFQLWSGHIDLLEGFFAFGFSYYSWNWRVFFLKIHFRYKYRDIRFIYEFKVRFGNATELVLSVISIFGPLRRCFDKMPESKSVSCIFSYFELAHDIMFFTSVLFSSSLFQFVSLLL